MEILKNFVVFEGSDGSGTTTQLNILDAFFHPNEITSKSIDFFAAEPKMPYNAVNFAKFPPFYKTFEPSDGIIGKIIRSGLKKEGVLNPKTIAYLFAADRNEHIFGPNGVAERCKHGELVVSDRYVPSSLVYQGITCGEELPAALNKDFPAPELLIFFDIDSEIAQKRIATRAEREIYENLEFQILVRERYKALIPRYKAAGVRVETIDASLPPMEIAFKVWALIENLPIFKM